MWQLDSAATNASSGSTASSREKGSGTTLGEEEAGDRDAAVEAPFVRAAVAALGKILAVAAASRRSWRDIRAPSTLRASATKAW